MELDLLDPVGGIAKFTFTYYGSISEHRLTDIIYLYIQSLYQALDRYGEVLTQIYFVSLHSLYIRSQTLLC